MTSLLSETDTALALRIETAAALGWAPAITIDDNGWWIRLDSGYTGRANSVWVYHVGTPPFDDRVTTCERLYRERGLPPVFRLTTITDCSTLDSFLDGSGYQLGSRTFGYVCHTLSPYTVTDTTPLVHTLPIDDWLTLYDNWSERVNTTSHRAILDRITTPAQFAVVVANDVVVAVGLSVVHDGLVGIFDVVVNPAKRRKGYGEQLMRGMLAWGVQQGATVAYLQVTEENSTAQRLYQKLGFSAFYRYWYRRKQ